MRSDGERPGSSGQAQISPLERAPGAEVSALVNERCDGFAAPLVIIVGGKHGTFDGITNHVPDGVQVTHVPDAAGAQKVLEDIATRSGEGVEVTVSCCGLQLRLVSRLLIVGDRTKELPDLVFWLLYQLMISPKEEFSAEHLRREVWEKKGADTLIVRQGVHRLRVILETLDSPACIEWTGAGYRLVSRSAPHRSIVAGQQGVTEI